MSVKKVSIMINQNNSKELFKKWNKKNQGNIKCSIPECSEYTKDAYVVNEVGNSNKFITPLCPSCYKQQNNDHSNGLVIFIERNLLLKYNN